MTVHENAAKAAAALWPKVQTLCKNETARVSERGRKLAACVQSINHWEMHAKDLAFCAPEFHLIKSIDFISYLYF